MSPWCARVGTHCFDYVLGGKQVSQGPFVMNSRDEVLAAYADYRRGAFGEWPWPQDAMVWPRGEGRFASHKKGKDVVLERPPGAAAR